MEIFDLIKKSQGLLFKTLLNSYKDLTSVKKSLTTTLIQSQREHTHTSSLEDSHEKTDIGSVTGSILFQTRAGILPPLVLTKIISHCSGCNWFAVKSQGSEQLLDELVEILIQGITRVQGALMICPNSQKAGEYHGLFGNHWDTRMTVAGQVGPQESLCLVIGGVETTENSVELSTRGTHRHIVFESLIEANKARRRVITDIGMRKMAEVILVSRGGPVSEDITLGNWFSITKVETLLPASAGPAARSLLHRSDAVVISNAATGQVDNFAAFWRADSNHQEGTKTSSCCIFANTSAQQNDGQEGVEQNVVVGQRYQRCSFKSMKT